MDTERHASGALEDQAPDDERFLDRVLDRAIDLLQAGKAVMAEELAAERPHLLAQVQAQLHAALEIVPRAARGMPTIAGYVLLSEVGRGGMGTVYLARQERVSGRPVALKVLSEASTLSRAARRRFRLESEAIARLRHPNIVGVHDVVEPADHGVPPAFAMEWVEGRSLASVISHVKENNLGARGSLEDIPMDEVRRYVAGGPATPGSQEEWAPTYLILICRIGAAMARALAAVHGAGLLHRDVKPSNIIVRRDGAPLLTDFGLARDVESDATMVTQSGQFVGTPAYAAPEQLRAAGEPLDERTDVYSLGVTLYHALALKLPFEPGRGAAGILRDIESEACAPLRRLDSSIPRDVATIVAKAMEPQPADRYQNASELAQDLERFLRHEPIAAVPRGTLDHVAKFAIRHPGFSAGLILAVLALAAGTIAATWGMLRAQRAEAAAALDAERARTQAEFSNVLAEALSQLIASSQAPAAPEGAPTSDSVRTSAARQVLERVRELDASTTAPAPDAEASERLEIANQLRSMAFLADAEAQARRAVSMTTGPDRPLNRLGSESLNLLAMILIDAGRSAEAEPLVGRVVEFVRQDSPGDLPVVLINHAYALEHIARYGEAQTLLDEVLAIARKAEPEGPGAMTMSVLPRLAELARRRGDLDGARALWAQVQAGIDAKAPSPVDHAQVQKQLSWVERDAGRPDEAERLLRASLTARARHGFDTGAAIELSELGDLQHAIGENAMAEATLRTAQAILRVQCGTRNADFLKASERLVAVLAARGKDVEAKRVQAEIAGIKASMQTPAPPKPGDR